MPDIEDWKPDLQGNFPDKSGLKEVHDFDDLDFRNGPLNGIFHAGLKCHVRHGAVAAVADEFQLEHVVLCDLQDTHISTVGLEVRPDAVERLFDAFGEVVFFGPRCGSVHIMHSSQLSGIVQS